MIENPLDGSMVLETLAERGQLEEFYEAVDSDNFAQARALLKEADVDEETIAWVLSEMENQDGDN